MVLAERNSELVRNGRRSRGPSPNGHGTTAVNATGTGGGPGGTGTPETSSDDDNSIKRNGKSKTKQSEYEEKIRVGRDYQAVCPSLIPENERKPECINDRALLVWSPTKDIPDTKLEEYISVAKEKYGYNGEQALGMLFWHKHDLERAVMDLANFTPFPDEWTLEDKVLFEQAFQFHGKSFHRIRQMLPDKSIASLVKYYYSWKKTRHRQSVMDRQEKTKISKESGGASSENGSDNGSNEDSDNDDKEQLQFSSSTSSNSVIITHDRSHDDIESSISTMNTTNVTNSNCQEQQEDEKTVLNIPAEQQQYQEHVIEFPSTSHQSPTLTKAPVSTSASPSTSSRCIEPDEEISIVDVDDVLKSSHYQHQHNHHHHRHNSSSSHNHVTTKCSGSGNSSVSGDATGVAGCCSNCGVACNQLHLSPHGKLCASCHHHWRRTGNKRPTSGPCFGKRSRDRYAEKHKRKPPRGMYINHDDIVSLASASTSSSANHSANFTANTKDNQDELLSNIDREIVSLLSQIQLNKQNISSLKRKNSENLDDIRPPDNPVRINARWTNDELMLAVQGIEKYGKDFQTIADVLGTKTEAHVRSFYVNNRRRYNLDQALKKHGHEKETVTSAMANCPASTSSSSNSSCILDVVNSGSNAITKKSETLIAMTAKSKDVIMHGIHVADDSDSSSSETVTTSKSFVVANSSDKRKAVVAANVLNKADDDGVVEVYIHSEEDSITAPPPTKKIALGATLPNQSFAKFNQL